MKEQRFLARFVWFYSQSIRTKYSASQQSLFRRRQNVSFTVGKDSSVLGESNVGTTS